MSISRKLQVTFAGVLVSFSVLLIAFTMMFFKSFYNLQKRSEIKDLYSFIYKKVQDEGLENIENSVDVRDQSINLSLMVALFDEKGVGLRDGSNLSDFTIKNGDDVLDKEVEYAIHIPTGGIFFNYIEKSAGKKVFKNIAIAGKVVSKTDESQIIGYIVVFTPEKVVENNSRILTVFIIYETILFLIIAFIIVTFISNRLSKPLKEAEEKTKRMANLDFSSKLDINSYDEIGSLSISINKMSDELEKNINMLKDANAKLEQDLELETKVNQMRQEFISDVSHELKTPISIIGGYSEALKLEGIEKEDINAYADIIIDESKRMNKLVRDLLKFTQIESGFAELDEEDFQLVDLISQIVNPYALELKEKQITLTQNILDISVNGDFDMMSTVFSNFFTNAMHYVDSNRIININSTIIGDKVRVSVENSGIQIEDSNKDRIWDSFYKADKARTRKYGGSGLGLSIVKSIMKNYKNDYGFNNTEIGVEFYFDLNLSNKK